MFSLPKEGDENSERTRIIKRGRIDQLNGEETNCAVEAEAEESNTNGAISVRTRNE